MKTILVPAAAAALLALAPLAASAKTSGDYSNAVIKSVNASARTVTLNDGSSFGYAYAALAQKLQPGAHVSFHWQDINGGNVITDVNSAG
jgi:Cu/Ag efflux protein CusF